VLTLTDAAAVAGSTAGRHSGELNRFCTKRTSCVLRSTLSVLVRTKTPSDVRLRQR